MAEIRTTIEEIRLILENEMRAKKSMPRLSNINELKELSFDECLWEEVPGIFSMAAAKIDDNLKVIDNGQRIVFKLFANKETMEVRQFVSKFTDEPLTKNLPD